MGRIESQGVIARLFRLEKHVAPGTETESRPVFVRTVQLITKVRAFGGVTENAKGEALGFPPLVAVWPFAMNQFRLIAICLGLASSALGTFTSSIPSR